jgi:20S proteasome alpha/beta subunit
MTCIIRGGKCIDGVVLVADRKVIYGNGNVVSREKIFKDYHPFVIAS